MIPPILGPGAILFGVTTMMNAATAQGAASVNPLDQNPFQSIMSRGYQVAPGYGRDPKLDKPTVYQKAAQQGGGMPLGIWGQMPLNVHEQQDDDMDEEGRSQRRRAIWQQMQTERIDDSADSKP